MLKITKQIFFLFTLFSIITVNNAECGEDKIANHMPYPEIKESITLTPPLFGVAAAEKFWHNCAASRETGAQWTYAEILWSQVEPKNNSWDWKYVDKLVSIAKKCGIELTLKIRTGQLQWATGGPQRPSKGQKPSLPPLNFNEYKEFIKKLAEHLKGRVTKYAIENEASTMSYWGGNFEEYQKILKTAYEAIREVDASGALIKVVDFGVASEAYLPIIVRDIYEDATEINSGLKDAISFCKRYVAHRGISCPETKEQFKSSFQKYQKLYDFVKRHIKENGPYYDIYQLHFYEEWDLLPYVVSWIKRQMANNNYQKPIEGWEIGYAWQIGKFDTIDHAQDLIRVISIAFQEGIERINYLPYQAVSHADKEIWRGLYDPNGNQRPALHSYRLITETISQAKKMDILNFTESDLSGVFGYKFYTDKGQVYLLWANKEGEISLPIDAKTVMVKDYIGKISHGISSKIRISSSPIFVHEYRGPPL